MPLSEEVSRARREKKKKKCSQAVTTNREKSAEVIVSGKVESAVGEGPNF